MGEALVKLIDDLIRPGNRPFLVAFTVVLVGLAVFVIFVFFAWLKKEKFNRSLHVGPLWIHLTGGENDPKVEARAYRKLCYVKVNFLSNRKTKATPFYVRTVDRLDPADRAVAVFDEAVYHTLKLYPAKRSLGAEKDVSTGVVDPRLLIPWLAEVEASIEQERRIPQMADIEARADSDTMFSVSHFLNGLQGASQDFCTYADEDAESLRLVVDFSSIPNAAERVVQGKVELLLGGRPVDSDDLKFQRCGESVYMAHCKDAKKGSLLKMYFTFKDWEGAAFGGA